MEQELNYERVALEAERIAKEAGRKLMEYFRVKGLQVSVKLNESDIVTAADKASEQIVVKCIADIFPHHCVLTEESGLIERGKSDWEWIIDPLDGTTNFSEGLPAFAVSIGVQYRGTTVAGVVHAPYLGETFRAVRGGGAWFNGKPASCRPNKLLERAVVSTGFPVDKNVNPDNNIDNLARVLPHVRGMRRLGSAALDLCYVGAGFLDGYWEMNLHIWDVCAGMLFVEEAGGMVEEYRSDRNISLVAASAPIFPQLRELIR